MTQKYSASQTLRAIGQGLEDQETETFDMERQGEDFLVILRSQRPKSSEFASSKGAFRGLLEWWNRSNKNFIQADQSSGASPAPASTRLRYTPDDVERLERAGQARRSSPNEMPNAHGMSQLLRASGGYVDRKNGRLQAVSWRDHSITIVYDTVGGRREVHVFRHDSMYDIWVRMYVRRGQRAS
jgi:hypothetical protein